ncbi:DHH family phosphoesterase [Streptococcus cameli]
MTIFQEILEKIKQYETIIIHRHQRPDPDAIGSQAGLRALLQENFPEKRILATGVDEPTLTWMAEMDQVETVDYEGALVIVTDTANTPRIDDNRYSTGDFLIKIDHHPNEDPYGDLLHVDATASSASEIITDFALETGLNLSNTSARLLYAGIVGDTGRFLYPATTSKTMQLAASLREFDFDFAAISRQMDSFSFKIAKLQGYIFDHLEVDENGAARVTLTQDLLETFQVTDAETAAIVGTPGKIDTVQSWAIFVEQPNGSYRVRLRSKVAVINEIAKRHDGGGHPLASGANSYSLEENEAIYQEIKQVVADARND